MRSVLVVDDDDDVRDHLRTILSGHDSLRWAGAARDGAEAVQRTLDLHPDLVVVDMGLPDLAGHDLLGALRRARPTMGIVVFTASASAAEGARGGGADEVLRKGEADLRAVVDSLQRVGGSVHASSQDFGPEIGSVRSARRAATEALRAWGCTDIADEASLVISELTTNAVTHARSAFRLSLALFATGLRIEVTDRGPGVPEPQPPDSFRAGGRGLALIGQLARSWGIDPVHGGKTVWAFIGR